MKIYNANHKERIDIGFLANAAEEDVLHWLRENCVKSAIGDSDDGGIDPEPRSNSFPLPISH